ncbi:MAG: Asp-tRNA(Asn)/Glu-tRNA(Gln) amidotransferase subunit GatB [bacterium]
MIKDLVPVIGIEVHVEPKTESKMFCDCGAQHFGVEPNTNVCPVCLGMPGALPVPNRVALEQLVFLGSALGCTTNKYSYFERKNYFYPDLPKGYQISQYRKPLCVSGQLPLPSGKVVRINRAHMEEDTAKMKHLGNESLIDFNRSGVPLIEIVSEADITSASEAKEYLKQMARLIRWLNISDASMEKGTMRLEANISLQESKQFTVHSSQVFPKGKYKLNPRVELKNINSFRFVEKAIEYEIGRQTEILESGGSLVQETRGWDEKKQATFAQRTKETSSDYRYFPEPDVPPVKVGSGEWKVESLGILPWEVDEKLAKEYQVPYRYIAIIAENKEKYEFFELCLKKAGGKVRPEMVARVVANTKCELTEDFAKEIVEKLEKYQKDFAMDDESVTEIARKIIDENQRTVADYKGGKENALHSLVGAAMISLKGRGDPKQLAEKLRNILNG